MSTDAKIQDLVRGAFAGCPRPEHFADYNHCLECREHDDLLRNRDLDSLTIEDVGNACWDPIAFCSPEGFCYLLPALVRLSLDESDDFYGWYFQNLLFHLTYRGEQNQHLRHCSPEQRKAIGVFIRHVAATRAQLVDYEDCESDLRNALKLWEA